jgi:hypothetical protein
MRSEPVLICSSLTKNVRQGSFRGSWRRRNSKRWPTSALHKRGMLPYPHVHLRRRSMRLNLSLLTLRSRSDFP